MAYPEESFNINQLGINTDVIVLLHCLNTLKCVKFLAFSLRTLLGYILTHFRRITFVESDVGREQRNCANRLCPYHTQKVISHFVYNRLKTSYSYRFTPAMIPSL